MAKRVQQTFNLLGISALVRKRFLQSALSLSSQARGTDTNDQPRWEWRTCLKQKRPASVTWEGGSTSSLSNYAQALDRIVKHNQTVS